ncbi:hypothetical protein GCK72_020307 [Caenorhabditis remanei]|uniref:Uncharacterized protein n=1 Tax=Caenorhabditis remanei TaxID=31234 RepID=A0A6A5GF57_CAERE|nr:hypothetical protein GCK72_020307 [Caenorhabditis remanei]KAF1753750.1 hypothetical protein GCK72_020307 [Caenorhabditis remanei]
MSALALFLLLSSIFPTLDSCLVTRESFKCNCIMDRLDRSNINGVYNHKDYKYIITRNLLRPNVTQKGCWTTVFCEKGYSLYILDGTGIGGGNSQLGVDFVAYASCDREKLIWSVRDGRFIHYYTYLRPICVDVTTVDLCTPKTNTTFLFAYSNDISTEKVKEFAESSLENYRHEKSPHFTTLANVRLDVNLGVEETIKYHSDFDVWKASISSNLPDPLLGYSDPDVGSDVLTFISKFLNNTQAPICGSRIFILLKRSPDEEDISALVAIIKKYRVGVYTAISSNSSGGHHPETMVQLAVQTHGLAFYHDDRSTKFTGHSVTSGYLRGGESEYVLIMRYLYNATTMDTMQIRIYTLG